MAKEWLLAIWLVLYGAILIALTLRILIKRRPVGVTLSWLLFVFTLPFLGIIFYLLFGERYLGRLRAQRAKTQYKYYAQWLRNKVPIDQPITQDSHLLRPVMELTLGSLGMPAMPSCHWSLYEKSEDLFNQLISDISNAQTSIFLEFYILEAQGEVVGVLAALEAAVKRGVSVYLMLDSVGSHRFLRSVKCRQLRDSGLNILDVLHANFLRMSLRRQDLRQHRKLMSIDNSISYTGSMNLADPAYFKTKSGVGPWLDLMVRLEGDVSKIIQGTMIFDWEMETGYRLEQHLKSPGRGSTHYPAMQLLPSGPALDEEILLQVLLTAIYNAKKQIIITSPYFVPDEALLQALKSAAKRGLKVTIIVPLKNDSKLAQYAGRSFYEELLISGVKIQGFVGALLHTKTVIVDEQLVLIGSVNMDMRSIWLNFESTLVVDDTDFCAGVLRVINGYQQHVEELTLKHWRQRPLTTRMLENLAQLASPLL